MIDLMKLTALELVDRPWGKAVKAENLRRLEKLEKCEAALCGLLERHGNCLCSSCDAARAALEE